MTTFGYTLMTEEHGPRELVANAGRAEELGFDFLVSSERVFDLPTQPVPIAVAASGPESVDLAARRGDGLIATEPNAELVAGFRQVHPGGGSRWNQIPMCAVEKVAGAGYENIALVQIGEDQDGFFRFWQDELGPAARASDPPRFPRGPG